MRHAAVLAVVLVGCGSDGPEVLDGFDVPAPKPGEIQLLSPIVEDIAPGADITLCHYIDFEADRDYDISDYQGFQSGGGHHVLLYTVANHKPPQTKPCTEDDMLNARYLAGGGAEGGKPEIPEGIVMRLKKGSQLLIQTHWINATDFPLRGQGAFNIEMGPASPASIVADLFTVVSTEISIPPSSAGSTRGDCALGRDMSFFALGGHEHYRGTHVSITHTPLGGTPKMIYDHAWADHYESDPPRLQFTREAPFVGKHGDRFTIDCQYYNDTSETITFPLEMCVMFGYYFPADGEIDCIDGLWPQ
jgi:hypothetical protein